jgi:hypothetical protein
MDTCRFDSCWGHMDTVELENLAARVAVHEEVLVQIILANENMTQALSLIVEKLEELQSS